MPTKAKPPTIDQLREAMKADRLMGYSIVRAARDAESARARAAKASGKEIPTPINDWCSTDEYKRLRDDRRTEPKAAAQPKGTKAVATTKKVTSRKAAGRKAPANKKAPARGATKPRIAEADRVATIKRYVDKGMTTESEIVTTMRGSGIPVGPWIKPILAKLVKRAPANRKAAPAAKKAPARRRATPTELSKAHQTRGKGKKAPAVAASRQSSARVVRRTPQSRRAA